MQKLQTHLWRKREAVAVFLMLFALGAACVQKQEPVYASSRQALVLGSLYYSEAGCSRCHGVQFDGQGPETKALQKERGISTPNFKKGLAASKTPADYFKAITMGTPRYKDHAYQSYTDKGRWAMAHYLYSLSPPPSSHSGLVERRQALLAMEEMLAKKIYAKSRRWEMGYKPIDQRPKSPPLEQLLPRK